MQLQENTVLLRIFLGENDRDDGSPLYESLVLRYGKDRPARG